MVVKLPDSRESTLTVTSEQTSLELRVAFSYVYENYKTHPRLAGISTRVVKIHVSKFIIFKLFLVLPV